MIMDTLVLRLSDSSHASSPPSGSKSVSNCHFIPLLSTPASLHGHSPTDTGTSPAVVVQKTSKNNEQSVPTDSDLSSVLKGVIAYVDVRTECDNRSRAVESVLRQLGAEVLTKLSKEVTHVIYKDGKKRTRDVALRRQLHFVSVLWLVKCKELCARVNESDYPVAPLSHTPLPYGRYKRYRSMQPKSIEEDEADSAKKIRRRQARANKKIQLQTPSSQQRPLYLSKFFVGDTQPRLDLVSLTYSDSNDSSSSLTVPDTPPSLRKRLLAKQRCNDSETVTETPGDTLQRKLFSVADSPDIDDEPRSKSQGSRDTPVTSRLSSETSAVDEVRSEVFASSLLPLSVTASHQNVDPVQTTTSSQAPGQSVSELTVGCAAVTSGTSVSLVRTDSCHEMAHRAVVAPPESAWSPLDTLLLRTEATQVPQSSSGVDRSSSADRQSSSPEIDIVPIVKQVRATFDRSLARSSTQSASKQSLPCVRPDVPSGMNTVEPVVMQRSSVHRCGSPGLDEDGEFSRHMPKPTAAAVTHSQSNTAGGVKLIPLSQVMSTSTSSDTAAERLSVKISHVVKTVTEKADNKFPNNQKPLRSSPTLCQRTESVQVQKAVRRRSTRLRVPDSVLVRAKQHVVDGTKAVKFNISFSNAEPTDKENVCVQRTTVPQSVSSRQPSQQESEEISHRSANSRTDSRNSSVIGEESDGSLSKVRRSIKCARRDVQDAVQQRLPKAWERHTNNSPSASRRMSDRIKQKESDVRQNDCQKSPAAVTGRKRSASSSSSGPSSCEKKSTKKTTRTIAMTSLHSDEQARVRSVIAKLGGDFMISDSVVDSTTHIVCGCNRRTIKLLMGIARGCWVVSLNWVIKSEAAGQWLSEERFEQHEIFPVARISRLEKNDEGDGYKQKLFMSVGNVYVGEGTVPPRRDLMQLIALGGGQVTSCLRKAHMCVGQKSRKNIVSVSEQWVLDSVTQHKCLPFDGYRVAA